MPNGQLVVIKKPRTEVMVVAGLMAVGGVALILLALRKGISGAFGPLAPLGPGESLTDIRSANLDAAGVLTLQAHGVQGLPALDPTVIYQGAGRDTFSYFQVKQFQSGQWVTVYGSGVAGVHVGPAPIPTRYHLVSAEECQPTGCPSLSLCAFPWPGNVGVSGLCQGSPITQVTPICGAAPIPGHAVAAIEIYERKTAADGDGFTSPTCNPRIPVARREFAGKIMFI